jgi:DNA-binding CsgD family transcriptional regulator
MKDTGLTDKDKSILAIIAVHIGAIGPTEIGTKLGKSSNSASSYCSNSLKKLMNAGLIVNIKTYKVRYKLNKPFK